jgi:hypothetical protein
MKSEILSVAILGCISCIFAAFLLVWVQITFHADFMSYWVNLIIPIGAVVGGILSSVGFGVSARILGCPANGLLYRVMLVSGVVTFVGLVVVKYFVLQIDGVQIASILSFPEFAYQSLANGKMTFGHTKPTQFDIGIFGILLGIGKAAGFLGGFYVVFSAIQYREYVASQTGR